MAASMSLCTCSHHPLKSQTTRNTGLKPIIQLRPSLSRIDQRNQYSYVQNAGRLSRTFVVFAATEDSTKSSKSDEQIASWARPDTDELPPWARDEGNASTSQATFEIPCYAYLLASALTAIAAIGSIIEYANQKPVFWIVNSDSVFYAPLLGFFVSTWDTNICLSVV